ncbi:MAG TPA: YhcN/YlaJ family sporulation lipoprotein [Cerasibacillus sp.]|uniref:YhcN/YlaJ family sporulation lipoprotein n=1 Tax=Cerasibacillus sp. TaxID=2498711 RepID=UPI002F3FD3F5
MIKLKNSIYFFLILFFLIGCQANDNAANDPSFTKLSTTSHNQHLSNQIKDYLASDKDVTTISAVNAGKDVIVTIEIPHMKRFRLATIREKLEKDIKKEFNLDKVEVSTDQKIIMELDKLEKRIERDAITEDEIKKEVGRIMKLSKEET